MPTLSIYIHHGGKYRHEPRTKGAGEVLPIPAPWGEVVPWAVPGDPGEYIVEAQEPETGVRRVLAQIIVK